MTVLILSLCVIALLAILLFTPVYRREIYEHSSPYSLKVENKISQKKKAVLFGNNSHLLSVNHGSDIEIQVSSGIPNVPYLQVMQQSAYQPFAVRKIMLTLKKEEISKIEDLVITISHCDANGQSAHIPVVIKNYYETAKSNGKLSEDSFGNVIFDIDYMMKVDGNTYLSFDTNIKELTFYIFYNTETFRKINFFKLLFGGSEKKWNDVSLNKKRFSRF